MKNLLLLHLVVLIFGFTGVLGKLITIPSEQLVWYRMLLATISVGIYLLIKKQSILISRKGAFQTLLTGVIIAAHWIFFFEAIKQSNVSITLSAMATAALFTALLEPLFFKRKLHGYQLFLGLLVMLGVYFIFQFESENSIGLLLAIISAFLASLFTVINGKLIKKYNSTRISLYELLGGTLSISLYLLISDYSSFATFDLSASDWAYLLILSIVCTAFAFVASIKVMEELTPFTVSLSINLEPVYGILLAILFFGDDEKMSLGFYLGTLLILASLFLNVLFKRRIRKRGSLIGPV